MSFILFSLNSVHSFILCTLCNISLFVINLNAVYIACHCLQSGSSSRFVYALNEKWMLFPQHSEAMTWGGLYRYCSYFDLLFNQTSVIQINKYSKPRVNYSKITFNSFDLIIYSLNKSWVWVLLLDNVVLDINPNKHAAIIKTITLNTFKTVYFNSAACRSSWHSLTSALPYIYYNDTCRYYEKNMLL